MCKVKQVTALLLATLTLFALTVPALAAEGDPTVESSGSTHVSISSGIRHTYLSDQNGVALGGTFSTYTSNKESVKGPAYCVEHGLKPVAEGTQLPIQSRYDTSPKTQGAFAAGYPQVPLAQFQAENSLPQLTVDEYSYATRATRS